MRHIHFNVFVDDFLKDGLRHILNVWQNSVEIKSIGKRETAFADIFGTDLTSEVIEPAEDIGVDLLQTFDSTGFQSGKQAAFKEGVSLFLALSVDGVIAVEEPVKEFGSFGVGKVLCKFNDTGTVETIGQAHFAICRFQFETVSGTHKLRVFLFQLAFKPSPIVVSFGIIRLLIQNGDNIDSSKEPLGRAFIPSRPDFPVIKKSYGEFTRSTSNLILIGSFNSLQVFQNVKESIHINFSRL